MALGPVETVYLLALVPAVLWGFTPILDKRGMSLDGTAVQASVVVILVDLVLYGVALLVLRGTDAFAGIDLHFRIGESDSSILLGYRAINHTIEDGSSFYDVTLRGALAGWRIVF